MRATSMFFALLAAGGLSGSQTTETLYVATQNTISVYSIPAMQPRLIITGGLAGITQIATDSRGRRYASNFGTPPFYADSSVTEYLRGQASPALTRTNGASSVTGVAVDPAGNVYASSYYPNTVSIYHPGGADPFQVVSAGISGPGLLAFSNGEFYVGEFGSAQILRFALGSMSPDLTLTLKAPGTLPPNALTYGGPFAVGTDGIVFAAGNVIAADIGFEEFVNTFAPGQGTPAASVVVSMGANAASTPYVAAGDRGLYVSVSDTNSVLQYSGGKLIRTITSGLNQPGPLAVDAEHRLYVGNASGSVNVYAPGQTDPSRVLSTPGFASPVAIVVGR